MARGKRGGEGKETEVVGRRLCSRGECKALAFPGQWPLALGPGDHRGQCETGLLGDVFSAGPVCLFSAFLALNMSGVEEEGDRGVVDIDNDPQAGLWAGRILSWGLWALELDF